MMTGYIIRRLLATIPVMLVVAVSVFLMVHLTPGDPAAIIAGGQKASFEQIEAIREQMGLNRPVLVQLGDWLWGIVRGDLGTTLAHGKKSVAEMIRSRVIPSISLALLTEAFAVILGIPLGVIAAWKANTWIDRTVMIFSTLGFSIPLFWLGFIFMIIFAVQLGVLPATGYVPPSESLVEFLRHMIMPVVATGLVVMSLITRMTPSDL